MFIRERFFQRVMLTYKFFLKVPIPSEQVSPTQQSKKQKQQATDHVEKPKRGRKRKAVEDTADSKEPVDLTHLEVGTLNVFEYLKKDLVDLNLEQGDIDDMINNKCFKYN